MAPYTRYHATPVCIAPRLTVLLAHCCTSASARSSASVRLSRRTRRGTEGSSTCSFDNLGHVKRPQPRLPQLARCAGMVLETIAKCDVDVRKELYGGVVLTGGTALLTGVRLSPCLTAYRSGTS